MTYLILFIPSAEYMASMKLQHFYRRNLVMVIIIVIINIETTFLIYIFLLQIF